MIQLIKRGFHKQWNWSDFTPQQQPGLWYSRRVIAMLFTALMNNERKFHKALMNNERKFHKGHIAMYLDKAHTRLFKQSVVLIVRLANRLKEWPSCLVRYLLHLKPYRLTNRLTENVCKYAVDYIKHVSFSGNFIL